MQWATQALGDSAAVSNLPGSGAGILDLIGLETAEDIASSLGSGFSFGIGNLSKDNRIAVLIQALASDSASNILSTPSLVMLDNEEAEIIVGQNVPFVTGTQATTGGVATPFQTIQRQDVGLTLKVKPQINKGNAIKLDITQEVSSVTDSAIASDIITNKRSIKTSVLADDRDIVVLGGLIEDRLNDSVDKVPLLGDLPLLGALFRAKSSNKTKTNLMVFIHPVIVRDAALGASYAGGKYNYIREEQLRAKERDLGLLKKEKAPLLPSLDEFLQLPPPFDAPATSEDPDKEAKGDGTRE